MVGKQEIFCVQDGRAIEIIYETHQINIKRKSGKYKKMCGKQKGIDI
jgi:hypothetical protein